LEASNQKLSSFSPSVVSRRLGSLFLGATFALSLPTNQAFALDTSTSFAGSGFLPSGSLSISQKIDSLPELGYFPVSVEAPGQEFSSSGEYALPSRALDFGALESQAAKLETILGYFPVDSDLIAPDLQGEGSLTSGVKLPWSRNDDGFAGESNSYQPSGQFTLGKFSL